jgi:hypothetical protein
MASEYWPRPEFESSTSQELVRKPTAMSGSEND